MQRKTSVAAAVGSRCGRLPIAVAAPAGNGLARMKVVVYERFQKASKADVVNAVVSTWFARAWWVVFPFTLQTEFIDAMHGWSVASSIVAGVLLWGAWVAGTIALFAPRPWGFAIL